VVRLEVVSKVGQQKGESESIGLEVVLKLKPSLIFYGV